MIQIIYQHKIYHIIVYCAVLYHTSTSPSAGLRHSFGRSSGRASVDHTNYHVRCIVKHTSVEHVRSGKCRSTLSSASVDHTTRLQHMYTICYILPYKMYMPNTIILIALTTCIPIIGLFVSCRSSVIGTESCPSCTVRRLS